MERLMTTEEVADLLRIDAVTVRRLVTRGELGAYRVAGEYRFAPSGIETFLENQRIPTSATPRGEFDKFTERARKVLSMANEEAQQYNHKGVGVEHILLALMDDGEGVAARTLAFLKVEPGEVRAQVEALHPAEEPESQAGDQPGVTPQGKTSLELAVQEARAFGHHYIGTEHMLLGLLREEEGIAGQILRKSGVTLDEARRVIRQILAGVQVTIEPDPEQHGEA